MSNLTNIDKKYSAQKIWHCWNWCIKKGYRKKEDWTSEMPEQQDSLQYIQETGDRLNTRIAWDTHLSWKILEWG